MATRTPGGLGPGRAKWPDERRRTGIGISVRRMMALLVCDQAVAPGAAVSPRAVGRSGVSRERRRGDEVRRQPPHGGSLVPVGRGRQPYRRSKVLRTLRAAVFAGVRRGRDQA